jgi:nitrite reductase/ring-hydroxylating ferredoxin subunit
VAHNRLLMKLRLLPALLTITMVLAAGCKKEDKVDVPLVSVDITINLNLPEYNALLVTGGWAYITGGSEGLIVYRKSPDEFVAMDRHCTYRPEDLCKVYVDDSGVLARDTACCHSAFLLLDGSVTEGPAALGLKLYNTTFNGTTLRIFN